MDALLDCVLVIVGGGIGTGLRYGMMFIPYKGEALFGYPLITFIINFIGSFAIGFVSQISSSKVIGKKATDFIKVGILGGFTTFSSFSLDNLQLIEKGEYLTAGTYLLFPALVYRFVCCWGEQQTEAEIAN